MAEMHATTAEGAGDRDLSGRKLGDYEMIRRLGQGGMADVYLARQTSLGRQVAVKILKRNLAADEKYIRRFQQEARAAASLVHANIVQIHEVGCLEGLHFIAQEYVQGQNVRQYLQRNGPLEPRLAARILRQVAAALNRSAQQNIIHRDIKPENIMLASTGEVKVADFGLARFGQEGLAVDLTQVGETMGTPLYMSPEQVQGRAVDPRSDIYSLGVTSYQMLAGRPPFEGETPLSVAIQHLNSEPVRLETLRKDLPPALCRIVHRMLAKVPDERYQSANELLRDLRTLHIDGDDGADVAGFDEWTDAELTALSTKRNEATQQLAVVMQAETVTHRRRRYWIAALAFLVVLGFASGGLWAWYRQGPSLLEVPPEQRPAVPQHESARSQYFWASLEGTESALASVEQYFEPEESAENRFYVRRSWQRLGELYLLQNELDKAMAIYRRLVETVEDTEEHFRAVGLVGQAIVFSRHGEKNEAISRLVAAERLLPRLNPFEAQNLIDQLDPDLRAQLDQMRRERGPVRNPGPERTSGSGPSRPPRTGPPNSGPPNGGPANGGPAISGPQGRDTTESNTSESGATDGGG